jgi:hypothetical protein
MAAKHQCENCGAVLSEEDLFCGECGAPQPEAKPAPEASESASVSALEPTPAPEVAPAAVKPARVSEQWRTVSIIVATLAVGAAVLLCVAGLLVAFFVPEADTGLTATQDMLIFSGLCCFCPGALAVILAIVLWAFTIRRK